MCRADETQLTGLVGTVQPCILDRCLSRRTSHAKKPKKKAIRSLHQLRSAVDTAAERALAIVSEVLIVNLLKSKKSIMKAWRFVQEGEVVNTTLDELNA